MVTKIKHSPSLLGIILYNQKKVLSENAEVIFTNEMINQDYSNSTAQDIMLFFEPYLIANKRTKSPAIHISINPDPRDSITRETAIDIIKEYLEGLGYKDQPYLIYEHNDIERKHYHVVTTCVDRKGKKINDSFEKQRAWKLCRGLENKYNLHSYKNREKFSMNNLYPVDYVKGNTKAQIHEVAGMVIDNFKFQSINELATFLKIFNIALEYDRVKDQTKKKKAVLYQCLNEEGKKVSIPVFSSSLGKKYTYSFIEKVCRSNKQTFTPYIKDNMKRKIEQAKEACRERTPQELKKQLRSLRMDISYHRNKQGELYGVTFIDYKNKLILNGSHLGDMYTANTMNTFLDGTVILSPEKYQQENQNDISSGILFPYSQTNSDEEAFKQKLRKKNNLPRL